jgi:preprotein translocase subunit SecE
VARDRKRAKQRQQRRRVRESAPASSPAPIHSDLADTLAHVSGEVDEFDAAIIRGAGGTSAAPGTVSEVATDTTAADSDEQLLPAAGGGGIDRRGDGSSGGGDNGGGDGRAAPLPAPRQRVGNRAIAFLRASWAELQRVQWPDRRQVTQATAVVLGFVAIAGAYLGLADYIAKQIVDAIL